MNKLWDALITRRPGRGKDYGKVRLLHDNGKPHTAQITWQTLQKFRWEVLPHPPYAPCCALSDYHLFRALHQDMLGKQFDDQDELKGYLDNFFKSKSLKSYEEGIMDLPRRWEKVIDNDGAYLDD